jgi:hypothetical protein
VTTPPDPGSGDRPPVTRLDRAPGERYRVGVGGPTAPTAERQPSTTRAVVLGGAVGLGGALLLAALGLIELHAGLLAVGLAIGWATGLVVRSAAVTEGGETLTRQRRSALAATLAGAGIVVGFLLIWLWARAQGGTLSPLDYLGERFGLFPWLVLLLGGAGAALRAR